MKMIQSRSKKFISMLAALFMISFGIMASGCGGGGGGDSYTPPAPVEAPGVPENVEITGVKGQGMLTLTLTWEKPLTGGAVASYEIYRSDSPVGVFDPANHYVSLPADTYTFIENAGMEDNTSYWVVAAKNVTDETAAEPVAYTEGNAGGGELEGYGNNFSAALIFADGYGITGQSLDTSKVWTTEANSTLIDYNTGLRPLISQDLTVVPDGILPYLDENTSFIKENVTYYKQQTVSTWQGQWEDGWKEGTADHQHVTAKWGDNLGSQNNLTTNSVIRVEMGLTKEVTTPMISYNMENLYDTTGRYEMHGTDGTTYDNIKPIVYASTARLRIQKVDNGDLLELPTPVNQPLFSDTPDGPGKFGAEVTISGNLTYGFVWDFRENGLDAGTYRITFLLDSVADNMTAAVNNTFIDTLDTSMTPNAVKVSDTEVYIDIDIAAQ